jgi:hypothetical protein
MKKTPERPERLVELEEMESEQEWLQLIQMERMIERQKQELLKTGAHDLDIENDDWDELREAEGGLDEEEDGSLDDNDLAYITAILGSSSGLDSNSKSTNAQQRARRR